MPFLTEEAIPNIFTTRISSLLIDYRQFVFVDFGFGKGTALLLATEFPFKRIIGVEFSPELHRIAEENIKRFPKNSDYSFEIFDVHVHVFRVICSSSTTIPEKGMFLMLAIPSKQSGISDRFEFGRRCCIKHFGNDRFAAS